MRQVRYEKLREEFTQLVTKMCRGKDASQTQTQRLEAELAEERADARHKLALYKDQAKKLKENSTLYRDTIEKLQKEVKAL